MCATQQGRPEETLRTAQEAFGGAENSLPIESPRCLCCRRPLSDPSSVRRGYGPRCFARLHLGRRTAMVASARQRLDHLSATVDGLADDQLLMVNGALGDLLEGVGIRMVVA